MQVALLMLFASISLCYAAPKRSRWATDSVLYQNNDHWNPKGYTFGFETSSGSTRREKGVMKENDEGNKFFDVQGEYSYVMPDGVSYTIFYKANDRGYQQSPPIMLKRKQSKFEVSKPTWTIPPSDGPGRQNAIENGLEVNSSKQDTHTNSSNNNISPQLITDEELQLIFNDNFTDVTSTTESLEYTTMDFGNETDINGLGNRVGLPSDVIGSLLG